MAEKSANEILRNDPLVRQAGETIIAAFKYYAGVCWAPVVFILGFFQGGNTQFGVFVRILLSGSIIALMIAGALFFLAYQKQSLMFAQTLMSEDAMMRVLKANPSMELQIEQTQYIARRLGNIADRVAFPLMTGSYLILSIVAVVAVWL